MEAGRNMEPPQRDLTFVFDVAGVLLEWDSSVVYDEIFARTGRSQKEFFSRVLDADVQQAMSSGQPMRDVLNQCAQDHPHWMEEIHAWLDRWDEMLVGEIGGTVAVAEELQERGYRCFHCRHRRCAAVRGLRHPKTGSPYF
jgi:2-haloacid dehalogenase